MILKLLDVRCAGDRNREGKILVYFVLTRILCNIKVAFPRADCFAIKIMKSGGVLVLLKFLNAPVNQYVHFQENSQRLFRIRLIRLIQFLNHFVTLRFGNAIMLKELFKRLHRLVKTYLNQSFGRYSFFLCHDITFLGIPGWRQRLLFLFPVVFDVLERNGNIVVLFFVAAAEGFDCVFFVKPAV